MVRGRNINAGGVNNVVNGGANRKICVDEGKRKGTNRKVPQFGQGNTRSTHHLSGLGRATCQCWGHVGCRPILRRKSIFCTYLFLEKYLFWGKTYFWKERPKFGACAIGGKKVACKKLRKRSMQEEKQRGAQEGKPNHDRVRVFEKYCNCYKP
jgi:hypothetical protein